MLVSAWLEESAARAPAATALVCGERRLSYRELADRAGACARGLAALGVERGDRVVLHLDNDVETVVALFGVLGAGAAFVMVNPTTKEAKLRFVLENAGASAIVLPAAKAALLEGGLPELRAVVTVGGAAAEGARKAVAFDDLLARHAGAGAAPPAPVDLDLATLLYTSGSTGEPKGVMLTHANVVAAIDSVASYLHLTSDDVLFDVLPLSFGYGLTQLFSALKVGARFVLDKGMVFPHVTLTRMTAEGVTGFAMVPTMAAVLLGLDLAKYDLSRLRYVTNAGAALPTDHVRRFRAALPHVDLVLMYGQTECLRIAYLEPSQVDRRPDSVGFGMPNQDVFVLDEAGQPVPPDTPGELVVRGSHVMRGYWKLPEQTEAKLRPGRFPGERVLHTGDLFRRDAEGYLYFVSRQDDIIKSKGEKVSPREVEDALFALADVQEAAVVGVADPVTGQAVKAVLVLREGAVLSAREVQRHCAQRLEDFMVPSIVEFREELPKTTTGKILKRELALPAGSRETRP
ncbi:MAG: AMP-binding protein [Vicinamibacteria bacterium]